MSWLSLDVELHYTFFLTHQLLRWLSGKESICQCRRRGFNPWVGKIPWRRKWQPPPVFLPGQSHGQRSLVGYSPWGHKESDMNEETKHAHNISQAKWHTHQHNDRSKPDLKGHKEGGGPIPENPHTFPKIAYEIHSLAYEITYCYKNWPHVCRWYHSKGRSKEKLKSFLMSCIKITS